MDNFVEGNSPKMLVKTPSKLLKQLLRYKDLKIWTTIISLSHVEHWLVVNVADDDVINISLPVSNTWLHSTWLQVHVVLTSVHSWPPTGDSNGNTHTARCIYALSNYLLIVGVWKRTMWRHYDVIITYNWSPLSQGWCAASQIAGNPTSDSWHGNFPHSAFYRQPLT